MFKKAIFSLLLVCLFGTSQAQTTNEAEALTIAATAWSIPTDTLIREFHEGGVLITVHSSSVNHGVKRVEGFRGVMWLYGDAAGGWIVGEAMID